MLSAKTSLMITSGFWEISSTAILSKYRLRSFKNSKWLSSAGVGAVAIFDGLQFTPSFLFLPLSHWTGFVQLSPNYPINHERVKSTPQKRPKYFYLWGIVLFMGYS
jgi:hypothetical protein